MKIICLSHNDFDLRMENLGLNDSNIDESTDKALISIIGTEECLKYWLDEADTKHYFSDGHDNVLNLEFDDLSKDLVFHGHLFKAITMKQAEDAVEFIETRIDNGATEFCVHCRAGVSRSRAISEFIYRMLQDKGYSDIEYDDRDDYSSKVNSGVLRRLQHAYWRKHKVNGYENGEEYPIELTDDGFDVNE